MGNITSLYLSDELKSILDEQKRRNPDFNLSAFIQQKLLDAEKKTKDPVQLGLVIEAKKSQIELLKKEVDILDDELRRLKITLEKERDEKTEKEIEKSKKSEELKQIWVENAMEFFDINLIEAREIIDEYAEIPQYIDDTIIDPFSKKPTTIRKVNRGTIIEFIKSKGYELKDDKKQSKKD